MEGFLTYFAHALHHREVAYISGYKKILPEHRHFHAIGVEQALNQYVWPASFVAPEQIPGFPYTQGQQVDHLYSWDATLTALTYLRAGLQTAMLAGNDERTLSWCEAILRWGLGPARWKQPHGRLVQIGDAGHGISNYLINTRQLLDLEIVDLHQINSQQIPYTSAGLAKIFSLASTDGLVILDSRVAAALGECINYWLRKNEQTVIPNVLQIPRVVSPIHRIPTQLVGGANHPIFTRDYRWVQAQVRGSWLLHAVLERQPEVFCGDDLSLRAHKLEAALFMMGAQVRNCHQLPPIG